MEEIKITVTSVNYGTFQTHVGTITEVAGAMAGKNMKNGSKIFYNGTNYTGIEVT